jgi:long-chain acyl-CoA synthetase
MGVPIYWRNIMDDKKMKKADLSFLKDVLVGGDKTPPALEDEINNYLKKHKSEAVLSKGYSMTEASSLATFSNKFANEPGSVGIPLVKTKVAAFEPGTHNELRTGEIGELYISSTNLMNEYYNNPEATNEVKQEHVDGAWVHSGDVGYVNKDGYVHVVDRIKRMIIRSGFKVFPSEIEKVITSLDYVKSCAVVGVPDEKDVTAPKAYIVLDENCNKSESEINNEIYSKLRESHLPPYFEPVSIETIEELPTTLIGKVDYDKLADMNKESKSIK